MYNRSNFIMERGLLWWFWLKITTTDDKLEIWSIVHCFWMLQNHVNLRYQTEHHSESTTESKSFSEVRLLMTFCFHFLHNYKRTYSSSFRSHWLMINGLFILKSISQANIQLLHFLLDNSDVYSAYICWFDFFFFMSFCWKL